MPRLLVSAMAVVIAALLTSCSSSGGGGDRGPRTGSSAGAGPISASRARSIAVAAVHGGKVTAVSIAHDFATRTVWKVEVIHHGRKKDVDIAERTGKVLKVENG